MGSHRADPKRGNRSQPVSAATGGHRRATRQRQTPLARLLRTVPAVPTFVGVAVLGIAGAGAVTVGNPAAAESDAAPVSAGSRHLTGTDAVAFSSTPREMAISRDSERQALQDAAEQKLQRATEQQAAERNAELKSLGKAAEARASQIAKNQWHVPTTGYRLTARFGMSGGLWSSNHTGLDFAAPTGTPIVAIANGVITETGYDGSYGNKTVQRLEDGTELWYCHQNSVSVNVGDTVTSGSPIGTVGSTGNTTGPHLHLEVRPGGGDPVDPLQALVFHGVRP